MNEILPGVHHWETLHPRIDMMVSSYWLADDGVAIDPLLPKEGGLAWFAEQPLAPSAVLLSNRHHLRDATRLHDEFGCEIYCSREGLHEFSRGEPVTAFDPGQQLPGGVRAEFVGGLCPDETALYMPSRGALAMADAVVRVDSGELGFVPDSFMDDPPATKHALLEAIELLLAELEFEHLLLAHGGPLTGDGRLQLQRLLDSGGRTAFEL
jgi:glyoxylase-like metal-dependent hydrolase (beta-lactamase superfamily II)